MWTSINSYYIRFCVQIKIFFFINYRDDIFPENICYATDALGYVNLMPSYGLNIYSMLKHDTLVLTVNAVKHIEERLLYQMNRTDATAKGGKFKLDQV